MKDKNVPVKTIDIVLAQAIKLNASDVHITANAPITVRIGGELVVLGTETCTSKDAETMLREILDESYWTKFNAVGEVDFSYSLSGVGRFRINAYRQRGSVSMAIRVIPSTIPKLDELRVPAIVQEILRKPSGLILVAGPAGSGKSTTLASMIDFINTEQRRHILTIEDPIEYLHRHHRSIINQRELGVDTSSYENALKTAMRQDADVVLVAELNDTDTMSAVLDLAESGRLVLSSMNTLSSAQTLARFAESFPPYYQQGTRMKLAAVLQALVCQNLIRLGTGTRERIAVFEVLIGTKTVKRLIRENKISQIPAAIEAGRQHGMISMEESLKKLAESQALSLEELAELGGSFGGT